MGSIGKVLCEKFEKCKLNKNIFSLQVVKIIELIDSNDGKSSKDYTHTTDRITN